MSAPALTIEIDTTEIMNVLFLEHDDHYRAHIARTLRSLGCTVHEASRPRDAIALLEPKKFQLVIADIVFEPPDIFGDKFIVLNKDLIGDARIVALTGQRAFITQRDEFLDMNVQVIDKGEEVVELEGIVTEIIGLRKDLAYAELIHAKEEVIAGRSLPKSGEPTRQKLGLIAEIKEKLLSELRAIENKEEKVIGFKGNFYSVGDLIREVENETPVGLDHIRMMLNLLEAERSE